MSIPTSQTGRLTQAGLGTHCKNMCHWASKRKHTTMNKHCNASTWTLSIHHCKHLGWQGVLWYSLELWLDNVFAHISCALWANELWSFQILWRVNQTGRLDKRVAMLFLHENRSGIIKAIFDVKHAQISRTWGVNMVNPDIKQKLRKRLKHTALLPHCHWENLYHDVAMGASEEVLFPFSKLQPGKSHPPPPREIRYSRTRSKCASSASVSAWSRAHSAKPRGVCDWLMER